ADRRRAVQQRHRGGARSLRQRGREAHCEHLPEAAPTALGLRPPSCARGARLPSIDMSVVSVDSATGSLSAGGERIFPLVLSNAPPPAGMAPSGRNGLAEVAA